MIASSIAKGGEIEITLSRLIKRHMITVVTNSSPHELIKHIPYLNCMFSSRLRLYQLALVKFKLLKELLSELLVEGNVSEVWTFNYTFISDVDQVTLVIQRFFVQSLGVLVRERVSERGWILVIVFGIIGFVYSG